MGKGAPRALAAPDVPGAKRAPDIDPGPSGVWVVLAVLACVAWLIWKAWKTGTL
jgi:hypothetical protein